MFTVRDLGIKTAIRLLLPHVVHAGALALRIQPQIVAGSAGEPEQKGGTRFAAALTAADLLVEDILGAAILALLSDVMFGGEEAEKDRVSQFFPKEAPYTVVLDPINGTLFYKNGLPIFDIILSIWKGDELVGAVDYLPAQGRFFIAIKGERAFTTTASSVMRGDTWGKFRFSTKIQSTAFLLTAFPSEELLSKLLITNLDVYRLDEYPGGNSAWSLAANSLLLGDIAAFVKPNASRLDWTVVAFIASEAGGAWNNPIFLPGAARTELVVAANSPEVYERIMRALSVTLRESEKLERH